MFSHLCVLSVSARKNTLGHNMANDLLPQNMPVHVMCHLQRNRILAVIFCLIKNESDNKKVNNVFQMYAHCRCQYQEARTHGSITRQMISSLSMRLLTSCVTIEKKKKKRIVKRSFPIYAHCLYIQQNRANDLFPAQRLPAPAKCLSTIDPQQNDLPACVFPVLSFFIGPRSDHSLRMSLTD